MEVSAPVTSDPLSGNPTGRCRVVVLAGYAPSLVNFRGPLLRSLVLAGCEVIACAPGRDEAVEQQIRELGATYHPLKLHRTGMNPLNDLQGFAHLFRLIRRHRPDVVLSYTIKPVIYGSLAARLAKTPKICSIITGLGYSFTKQSVINRLVRFLYRMALGRNELVFFQNRDDEAEFRRIGILPSLQPEPSTLNAGPRTAVVSGSGVDLDRFAAVPLREKVISYEESAKREGVAASPSTINSSPANAERRSVTFLLIARLLRDKGTVEFAAAARELKKNYPACRFQLLGPHDPNPAALQPEEVQAWVNEGALEYLGQADDVRPFLAECDVYVLPSYREGTPRTVLEAMAIGRAIVTTDAPGCRETVRRSAAAPSDQRTDAPASVTKGENGFLVPVRDAESLAWAMEQFILDDELTVSMGRASRQYAEDRYDVHKVNAVILQELGIARGVNASSGIR